MAHIFYLQQITIGHDDLGYSGHQIETPNIDALKSEGQLLEWLVQNNTTYITLIAKQKTNDDSTI